MQDLLSDIEKFLKNEPRKNKYCWIMKGPLKDRILAAIPYYMHTYRIKRILWHIENGIDAKPTCAKCGKETQWHDANGYGKYCSKNCQRTDSKTRQDKWNSLTPDEQHELTQKRKNGSIKKYGVDNPAKSPLIRQKLSSKKNEKKQDLYYKNVRNATEHSWKYNKHRIKNSHLGRSQEFHLDHIYSIKEGFDNDIPEHIIGHWSNLQILSDAENNTKGQQCGKTTNELYEDFNAS